MIFHWCPRHRWESAADTYTPPEFALDGFIHCSFIEQVERTASAIDAGRSDLVLLCIDEDGLQVTVEDCYEAGEPYPHLYEPLSRDSVVAAVPFPCRPDGSFSLPPGLP